MDLELVDLQLIFQFPALEFLKLIAPHQLVQTPLVEPARLAAAAVKIEVEMYFARLQHQSMLEDLLIYYECELEMVQMFQLVLQMLLTQQILV